MYSFLDRLKELVTNRIFIIFCAITLFFMLLAGRLYYLQILHGEESLQSLQTSIVRELSIPASRGSIYDRYGRPLAINEVAYSVKIDNSVTASVEGQNVMLVDLVNYLENKGETVADSLPFSENSTTFSFSDNKEETQWKQSIGLSRRQMEATPAAVMEFLEEKFEIPSSLPIEQKRKIASLGLALNEKNLMLLSLIQHLEENGETMVDDLPISAEKPYTFLFDGNESREISWKQSIGMKEEEYGASAPDTLQHLASLFDIPDNLTDSVKRKLISLRYLLYLQRYYRFQPVTIAIGISDKTVAFIEEQQTSYPGVLIDTDSLRHYTQGIYFSHILGYIRKISDTEYEDYKEYGYSTTDLFGKSGIERSKELDLNGKDGKMLVEVDNVGRRISTIETEQPVSGKNIFLTLDMDLQKAAYNYLEEALTDTLIKKLTAVSAKDGPISLKQFFTSMVDSNNIPVDKICTATEGEQYALYQMILTENPDFTLTTQEDRDFAKQIIIDAIENNRITMKQMVLVLYEQGKITADEEYLDRIQRGTITPLSVICQKLQEGEIHPSDTNLDPCTGSVAVFDVKTGDALAVVTYPSFDNNELVNNFNNEYYNLLMNDPTKPMINRPMTQNKAPGSTFKMITALAGLESGTITPNSYIKDLGSFTKTGIPYAKCWIYPSSTHGSINVKQALEVSCNYFFYELAYRMGNVDEGTGLNSITTLNEYMDAFGLNSSTGMEIGESDPGMASPAYKERVVKTQNPEATTSQTRWTDGDTIRTAIGQSVNNYAPVHMNKYIATLANRGTRMKIHMIDRIENANGSISEKIEPQVENVLPLHEENINAVFEGMLAVTQGGRGTLRTVFRDFPINVAAKSGTAQEDLHRSSHTWFVGFAPYEDPQIAITVMIPFGESSNSPAAVVAKNVIAEYMGLNYEPENNYMDNVLAK